MTRPRWPSRDEIRPDTPLRLSVAVLPFLTVRLAFASIWEAHAVRKQPPDWVT